MATKFRRQKGPSRYEIAFNCVTPIRIYRIFRFSGSGAQSEKSQNQTNHSSDNNFAIALIALVRSLDNEIRTAYTQVTGLAQPGNLWPGGVAVNILACHARDRGFESHPGRHLLPQAGVLGQVFAGRRWRRCQGTKWGRAGSTGAFCNGLQAEAPPPSLIRWQKSNWRT